MLQGYVQLGLVALCLGTLAVVACSGDDAVSAETADARDGGSGGTTTSVDGGDERAGDAQAHADVGAAGIDASTSNSSDAGEEPADAAVESNAPWCDAAPSKALQFDNGAIDLMSGDLGSDLPGGDVPRTIELWAKFLGVASWKPEGSILETGFATSGDNVLGLDLSGYDGTTAQFGPYTNGFSDNNDPNGVFVHNIPQAGWLHLSWSYTGQHGKLSFTVNGTEYPVKTKGGQPTMAFAAGIVTLGASQTFGITGWTGVMDEVRLWSIARTPAEVARDMKVVLRGTEPGLVAYYRFDEGSGTVVDDVTKKTSHRLSVCTKKSSRCSDTNDAKPQWVDSDVPGPFACAP